MTGSCARDEIPQPSEAPADGVLGETVERIGTDDPTALAARAPVPSVDPFVHWFLTTQDRLPEDFELAV